jgi:hypothetical protein
MGLSVEAQERTGPVRLSAVRHRRRVPGHERYRGPSRQTGSTGLLDTQRQTSAAVRTDRPGMSSSSRDRGATQDLDPPGRATTGSGMPHTSAWEQSAQASPAVTPPVPQAGCAGWNRPRRAARTEVGSPRRRGSAADDRARAGRPVLQPCRRTPGVGVSAAAWGVRQETAPAPAGLSLQPCRPARGAPAGGSTAGDHARRRRPGAASVRDAVAPAVPTPGVEFSAARVCDRRPRHAGAARLRAAAA